MSIRARNFFSATVTLSATTATSLETLMRNSLLDWGKNADGTPSLDSFIGSEVGITPNGAVFIGSDENVREANSDPLYKGVEVATNENYSLQDFGMRGIIDPATIWLYATAGRDIELVFHGV
jgi:hypothetical protein